MQIDLTPEFRITFPDGVFGALIARGCPNRSDPIALGPRLREVEEGLRRRFPGDSLDADPVAAAYAGYFRRGGARYPVVHQARTILAGRPIESPSALVAAMFAAEVDTLVLTSGHDLEALAGQLLVDVAREGETYTQLSGKEQRLRPGDMVVRDGGGIIASVLYGPDLRTRMREDTSSALFGAWCPVGVGAEAVEAHFSRLASLLRTEWPAVEIAEPWVLAAAGQ